MPANKVQADYDELEKIAGEFADESANMEQLMGQIMNLVGELEGGGWIGRGASSFFGEFHDLVEPGLQNLVRALDDGSNAIKQISNILSQAESDASSLFSRSR
ncbi:MAG: WXG100 family type VII secretion target [Chloroflexi bacterium]|nr:WXG100 family type VII secretion target [Chloroflexota bacterium]